VSGAFIVWLAVGLVTTLAVVAAGIALARHAILLVRTVARFQQEIKPIADEIASEGSRASSRAPRGAGRTRVRPRTGPPQ
jgi:hypothetical protein